MSVTPDGPDSLTWQRADAAALAAGFSAAAGVEATVTRDGAGTPVIDVPASAWLASARHARDTLGMDFLDWLSAVDQPDGYPAGLDVVLHVAASSSAGGQADSAGSPADLADEQGDSVGGLADFADGQADFAGGRAAQARFQSRAPRSPRVRRLLLRARVANADLVLPSLTALWPGAAWHERETFEMFGLAFSDYDDGSGLELRPLLLPDGFEGTPLRKSFVLAARAAKAWPGAKDPGDSGAKAPSRRKIQPPGVPDPSWGPREPGERPVVEPARVPRTARAPGPSRAPRSSPDPGAAREPGAGAP